MPDIPNDPKKNTSSRETNPAYHTNSGYGGYGYGYTGAYGYNKANESSTQTIKEYFGIFWRRKWLILFVFLVVSISCAEYVRREIKIYRATSVIRIEPGQYQVVDIKQVVSSSLTPQYINTQVRVIGSRELIQRVVRVLNLDADKDFPVGIVPKKYQNKPISRVDLVLSCLRVAPERETNLINIMVDHPNPQIAMEIANTVAKEYQRYSSESVLSVSFAAAKWLKDQVDDLKTKAEASEKKLLEYREKFDADALDERQNIVLDNLKNANTRLNSAKSERLSSQNVWEQLAPIQDDSQKLLESPFISNYPEVVRAEKEINDLELYILSLSRRYKEKHPRMIDAEFQLKQKKDGLNRAMKEALNTAKIRLDQSEINVKVLTDEYKKFEEDQRNLDRLKVQYSTLQRESNINRTLLDSLTQRLKETELTGGLNPSNVTIHDWAGKPNKPIKPETVKVIIMGMLGGALLGLGLAFGLHFLDDKIKGQFDIETYLQLPLLGVIPKVKRSRKYSMDMIAIEDKNSIASEAIRGLRASLRLRSDFDNLRCIMTTSTIPSEGKSFISSNLAIAFAQNNMATLVIDGDLRRPSLHAGFKIPNNIGLGNYLNGECEWKDAIVDTPQPNLHLMTAGTNRVDPAELLGSPKMGEFIVDLMNYYDRVIIDSTPLTAVSDALSLVPWVQGIIYVLKCATIKRGMAMSCVQRLTSVSAPVLGVVLNQVNKLEAQDYYYTQKYYTSYIGSEK
ncbi:MAG: polysaccharide biosynthesis tyrosine autokinase [Verrucomicrobiota bacterium]|nr:polysaccharide biosynthesis tyrosine autokinase [Verrucomicrobiota bacterium]